MIFQIFFKFFQICLQCIYIMNNLSKMVKTIGLGYPEKK